jgi:DNA-directed RNA polymerase sigma subunit (sigma70/sigma32)
MILLLTLSETGSALPDEKLEIAELGKVIREAIAQLSPKERTIVEYRFYRIFR